MGQQVIACGRQFTAAQLADTQNNNYSLPQIKRRPAFLRVKHRLVCNVVSKWCRRKPAYQMGAIIARNVCYLVVW